MEKKSGEKIWNFSGITLKFYCDGITLFLFSFLDVVFCKKKSLLPPNSRRTIKMFHFPLEAHNHPSLPEGAVRPNCGNDSIDRCPARNTRIKKETRETWSRKRGRWSDRERSEESRTERILTQCSCSNMSKCFRLVAPRTLCGEVGKRISRNNDNVAHNGVEKRRPCYSCRRNSDNAWRLMSG